MSIYTANRPATPYNTLLTITVGSPVTYAAASTDETLPYPLSITATPGSGSPAGILLVEFQTAFGGAWSEWPANAVSAATTYVLTGPVYALRFTADTRAGTVELAQ